MWEWKEAKALGFDLVGVGDPFCCGLQRAPVGHKPQDYLPGVKSVIALGMEISNSALQTTPSSIYSKHYDTINEALNSGAHKLVKSLEGKGYRSMTFPETDSYAILWKQYRAGYTGFVPCFNHMAVAIASGLGKLGRCGVVLTRQFGARQRWVSIVTEARLPFGEEMREELCLEKKKPGSCGKCRDACPIHAVSWGGTDVRKCWIHWTTLRDKGLACGICIKVCPVGKRS